MNQDRKIDIMGIVNLTDDSFYAGSRYADVDSALRTVGRMLEDGADIIDFGACSTRPGAHPVGVEEEWRRLAPVLEAVHETYPEAVVSVDTWWSEIVTRTYDLIGNFIVNDISAGEDDSQMLATVGKLGLGYIAMHKRGTPLSMQSMTGYQDVVREVRRYFEDFSVRAYDSGIRNWTLDPGFGFAKTLEQNWRLLSELLSLKGNYNGYFPRILVGLSRKSMICKPLGISPEDALPAVQAADMAALINGADILRVHDVREAVHTVTLYRCLMNRTVI